LNHGRIATPVELAPKISNAGLCRQRLHERQSAWLLGAGDDGYRYRASLLSSLGRFAFLTASVIVLGAVAVFHL
jgi:hypothetical protein